MTEQGNVTLYIFLYSKTQMLFSLNKTISISNGVTYTVIDRQAIIDPFSKKVINTEKYMLLLSKRIYRIEK